MKTKKRVVTTVLLCIVLTMWALTGCGDDSGGVNHGKKLSPKEALETMNALLSGINIYENEPVMDLSGEENMISLARELPEIDTYPLSVKGSGDINIEIMSSTEKSSDGVDGWINDIAEKFNKSGSKVNGKSVNISIRPIASGLALDYIISEKHIPDGFTPANELWGLMIESKGISIKKTEDRLVGNTAGILMKQDAYDKVKEKQGKVDLSAIMNEVMEENILLGYTNPYASSTGLNMLVSMLTEFDDSNPLSDKAVEQLIKFQGLSPPMAFTTAQMREYAKNGVIDVMIMEYQAYINEATLKDYVFTPMGVRHDSPMYVFGTTSKEKEEGIKMFSEFCKNSDSQKLAEKFGFNANDDYAGSQLKLSGSELFAAQNVWKKNKDGGKPVVTVFIADTSGSMEGTKIQNLKTSLKNSTQYINEDNYIGLVSYNSDVTVELPINQFDGKQKAYFNGAVSNLYANGETSTYDAVLVGLDMLLKQKEKLPDAKLMLFVLSDGETNAGYDFGQVAPVIEALGIPVHTIGYDADLDELKQLSDINEASSTNADENDVVYSLKSIFNAQM